MGRSGAGRERNGAGRTGPVEPSRTDRPRAEPPTPSGAISDRFRLVRLVSVPAAEPNGQLGPAEPARG
jgi:hypothetical protein